jgi:transcription elongation GreA/GreB family factor
MSSAFTKEDDTVVVLPDRPISAHPNKVTKRGLELIEAALENARRAYGEAQAAGDRDALASAGRDLRYWTARRATADVVEPSEGSDVVQFGSSVTIVRGDGRVQIFAIVGEDEADPAAGTISHVSPLARALMLRSAGESIQFGRDEIEIERIG